MWPHSHLASSLPFPRDMTLLTRIKTWEPRLASEGKWKFHNFIRQKDLGLVRLWENGTFDSLRDRSHKVDGENSWNLVLISTKNEESVTIKKWIPGSFNQDWQFNFSNSWRKLRIERHATTSSQAIVSTFWKFDKISIKCIPRKAILPCRITILHWTLR